MKAPNLHGIEHDLIDLSIAVVGNAEIGYTLFIKEYPELIVEGHTKTEGMINLMAGFHDLMKNHIIQFAE
jgi:hypothetical protein